MLCSELLTSALKLLGEAGDAYDNADYADRAPYIIAAFVGEVSHLDERYRLAHGLEKGEVTDKVYLPLDEEFPLCNHLAHLCVFYLASLLIADESPELSERYYDRYCDSISSFCASLHSLKESITDVYYR